MAVLKIKAPSWVLGSHLMEEQILDRKQQGGEKLLWGRGGEGFSQQMHFWKC